MKPAEENKLITFFKKKKSFSRKDLLDYFVRAEGQIKEGTLGWRIYDLKQKNILNEIGKGHYTLNTKPVYMPVADAELRKLAAFFQKNYSGALYCLWDINWLNEFTTHQFNQQMILMETEKDLQDSLANHLNDYGHAVVWDLRTSLLKVYERMVVVFPLVSRSPTQQVINGNTRIQVPTLEKLLVDIYQETKIFYFVQGAEMERIFKNALTRYSVNFSTLFSYAKRRGKESELRDFINKHYPDLLN